MNAFTPRETGVDAARELPGAAGSPRLRLIVPRQEGADRLAGWYLLNVHLQRALGLSIRVEPSASDDLVTELAGATGVLVFAHAQAVAQGVERAGWLPVVRPVPQFEEALIVSRKGVVAGPARRPLAVACGADHWLLPDLGIELLAQHGLAEDDWLLHSYDTTAQALNALLDGGCELAMLAVSDWQQLRPAAQHDFYRVAQSHSRTAFPALCVSPDLAPLRPTLLEVFDELHTHPAGRDICADLDCTGFEAVPAKALDIMCMRLRMHRLADLPA